MSTKRVKTSTRVEEEPPPLTSLIIPALPDDLALRCLARLSHRTCAAARATSRAWTAALSPSILNPIRKSSNLPSQQLLFFSLLPTDPLPQWNIVDLLYRRCFSLPKPTTHTLSCLLSGHAIATDDHLFFHLFQHLDDTPSVTLLRFSTQHLIIDSSEASHHHHVTGSSFVPDHDSVPTCAIVNPCLLKWEDWVHDMIQVPIKDSPPLWSAWVGLGSSLFVAGGTIRSRATSMAMTFKGDQRHQLAHLNEPRFMAAGLVFKGAVWVLGGRRIGDSGLEMVFSGEVFMSGTGKWRLVPEMWPEHLQLLEEKVPCVVSVKGRIFGLKMGSNMIVIWDEKRNGWDYFGLIGNEYVEKGFKGRILGVEEEKLWAVTEEPLMVFELETSVEQSLKGARPSEEVIQTKEKMGNLCWRRVDKELGLDGFRLLDCTLINL